MSKEHQFIIKTIVRGDRTPMYLETYSLGDRSSQVYKDAMKLLNSGDAQQEASLEMALAVTKEQNKHRNAIQVNDKPLHGVLHVSNDVDPELMQPTSVRNRLLSPNMDFGNPAGQVDLSVGGQQSYVSPGMKLARELEQRYPNKNWKGRVNKAFDAFNAVGSKYTPQDIAVCLISLCPNHDLESKYRELLALDYNVTVNVVRDILRIELDRMIAIDKAMENRTTLHLTLDAGDNPTEVIEAMNSGFATQYEKVGGVLFEGEELKEGRHPVTVIPLENNLRAWVRTETLNTLVCQAVDNDWTAAKLRRKVEHLFNTVGSPTWYTVVEGWFNTAMDVERASRGEQLATPADPLSSPLVKQLRDGSPSVMSDQTLVDTIHLMFAKGMAEDEQVVHAIFDVLGHPGNYDEFIAAERSCVIPQELRTLCIERFGMTEEPPRSFVADLRYRYHPEQLDDGFLINAIENAMQSGKITVPEAVDAVFEVQGNPANVSEFRRNNHQTSVLLSSTLYQECEKRFIPHEEPQPHFIVGDRETQEITSVTQTTYYRNEQFKDHVCFGSAPGSRSQEEIIGVLAYEMEANENEPDCVSVMHYQFFYQGDSVFVTDRYGNTVDRLR